MLKRIAINGFGRIGRQTANILLKNFPDLELVAINDLTDNATLAHLFKYDSVYGAYEGEVSADEQFITIDGHKIRALAEKDPAHLSWKDLKIDIVIESTGIFRTFEAASAHLDAGAKKVILSSPGKGATVIPLFVPGVNHTDYNPDMNVVSMASCTTNCLAPILKVLQENIGIEKALMSTIHSYTNDQKLLDLPHKDLRRARAAGLSIIPTTTGAATAAAQTVPDMENKIDGLSFRVPTPVVSLVDLVAVVKKDTSVKEINGWFTSAASGPLKNILAVTEQPLVSRDYTQDPRSSIVDLPLTQVIGNLVKICAWYDNEWGYSNRLAEFTEHIAKTS